jgi:uncharacterized membrane protein YphA (DoxX/SURF4 family)
MRPAQNGGDGKRIGDHPTAVRKFPTDRQTAAVYRQVYAVTCSNPEEAVNAADLKHQFDATDVRITKWMARHGLVILRVALGVVFVWFGALKLVPGLSPAEDLVRATVPILPGGLFLPVLAIWEIIIGLGFLTGRALRLTILLLFLQMPGTLAPTVLLPERVFTVFPFGLTLEGQYIVKNLVLIAAALVIGATVRGGRLTAESAGRPVRPHAHVGAR